MRGQAGQVLAANLRALRERAGLSLSELARRSDIAKGTLSQLETGTGNPTIETVFSLSNALGVPVSTLLTEPQDPDVVLVRSAGLDVLSSNAVDLRMLRRLDATDAVFELYDQRVRPGEVQRSAGHPGREHVIVISGVLRVGPPDAPYELGPGTTCASRRRGRTCTRPSTGRSRRCCCWSTPPTPPRVVRRPGLTGGGAPA
ncbi:helix-turn-helix domain-containing protein [Actinokineospora soli]|uniref:Helix-turn-helix domain-containing protein n=1 Tax=Actinokineospora soli TaxID=1048753 RepID=A0ABW2TQ54_9PSEU